MIDGNSWMYNKEVNNAILKFARGQKDSKQYSRQINGIKN